MPSSSSDSSSSSGRSRCRSVAQACAMSAKGGRGHDGSESLQFQMFQKNSLQQSNASINPRNASEKEVSAAEVENIEAKPMKNENKIPFASNKHNSGKARPRSLNPAPYYYYMDRSRDPDEDPDTPFSQPLYVPNFAAKMHAILTREELNDVIVWMAHGRSWKIIRPELFEKEILPIYFNHTKMSSFYRQANGWGFRRMLKGSDKGSFYNENFLRGLPHLSRKMCRMGGVKIVDEVRLDTSIANEPNLWSISEEHPVPEEVESNSLNHLVLKAINKCILEGGPKARMPVIQERNLGRKPVEISFRSVEAPLKTTVKVTEGGRKGSNWKFRLEEKEPRLSVVTATRRRQVNGDVSASSLGDSSLTSSGGAATPRENGREDSSSDKCKGDSQKMKAKLKRSPEQEERKPQLTNLANDAYLQQLVQQQQQIVQQHQQQINLQLFPWINAHRNPTTMPLLSSLQSKNSSNSNRRAQNDSNQNNLFLQQYALQANAVSQALESQQNLDAAKTSQQNQFTHNLTRQTENGTPNLITALLGQGSSATLGGSRAIPRMGETNTRANQVTKPQLIQSMSAPTLEFPDGNQFNQIIETLIPTNNSNHFEQTLSQSCHHQPQHNAPYSNPNQDGFNVAGLTNNGNSILLQNNGEEPLLSLDPIALQNLVAQAILLGAKFGAEAAANQSGGNTLSDNQGNSSTSEE